MNYYKNELNKKVKLINQFNFQKGERGYIGKDGFPGTNGPKGRNNYSNEFEK